MIRLYMFAVQLCRLFCTFVYGLYFRKGLRWTKQLAQWGDKVDCIPLSLAGVVIRWSRKAYFCVTSGRFVRNFSKVRCWSWQVSKMLTKVLTAVLIGLVLWVTSVQGDCRIRLVTDCDDLCSVSLQSPRVQVVRFLGRVASFGCVLLRSTWVCIQTILRLRNFHNRNYDRQILLESIAESQEFSRNRKFKIVCGSQQKYISITASGKITGSASWLSLLAHSKFFTH
jgi:hypothetical protein